MRMWTRSSTKRYRRDKSRSWSINSSSQKRSIWSSPIYRYQRWSILLRTCRYTRYCDGQWPLSC